jgi:G3E family GTPase
MNTPMPVTLIAGYLGAGKTTVVNHLLRHAGGRRLAVLVNEFGALPIDEDLIEAQDDDLISIAGGCICCSFGSDLTAALIELAEMTPRPDHVLIEASGVAIPGAIAGSVGLLEGFAECGVVVLADAMTIRKMITDEYVGDTLERQLRDAGLIVLTKSDLVPDAEATRAWMDTTFPDKTVLSVSQGRLAPEMILDVALGQMPLSEGQHADQSYESFVFSPPKLQDIKHIATHLRQGGLGIVRAKGFVSDKNGAKTLLQVVGNAVDVTQPQIDVQMGLVFIGLKGQLREAEIKALFAV